jgi:hypothetical protein
MAEPFLISSFFTTLILPFVLVFTLLFAILQKTKVLGDGKKQIDAIISLVIGLILIAFPYPRDIIVGLMPFLAVGVVILFVFMIFYGLANEKVQMESWLKWIFVGLFGIGLIAVLIYLSGYWDNLYDFFFNRGSSSQLGINILLIVIIAAAVVAVLKGEKAEKV